MSDLISRADLFNALANCQEKAEIFAVINAAPTVDAEPARYGHWEMFPAAVVSYRCSECKRPLPFGLDISTKFCPNCGAKMEGGFK